MTTTHAAPTPAAGHARRPARQPTPLLAIRARLRDGRLYEAQLPAVRHRRIQLGVLHRATDGFVELAAGPRPPGGKVRFITRKDPGHFLPCGTTATAGWLEALLALAEHHARCGEEVAVAPAVRRTRGAAKEHVAHTNWLWIDVDGAGGLPIVKALLRRKPAHLVVESAGSGGVHVYWRLDRPLAASGEGRREAIERAHDRLVYALGWELDANGKPRPTVADPQCRDRSRIMRLAGTVNGKTGEHARIVWADFALACWPVERLVGDLPDPPRPVTKRPRSGVRIVHDDPYKRISPAEYFRRLAGIEVPGNGLVSCPNPAHQDTTPSCHVGRDAGEGWCCHGCGAAGAIYDLASVLDRGPTGTWLRGDRFRASRTRVRDAFGELPRSDR